MSLFPSQPLEQIREGMTVVDASGARLGTVKRVHMGNPEAALRDDDVVLTTPPDMDEPSLAVGTSPVWSDSDTPHDLPAELRLQLLQSGFVEIDGPALHGSERFVPGDAVRAVSGDQVVLHRPPTHAAG